MGLVVVMKLKCHIGTVEVLIITGGKLLGRGEFSETFQSCFTPHLCWKSSPREIGNRMDRHGAASFSSPSPSSRFLSPVGFGKMFANTLATCHIANLLTNLKLMLLNRSVKAQFGSLCLYNIDLYIKKNKSINKKYFFYY